MSLPWRPADPADVAEPAGPAEPAESAAVSLPAAGPVAYLPLRRPEEPPARVVRIAALVAVGVAVLGAPYGLLWAALAPDVPVLVTAHGPTYAQAQPEQLVAADGWFALLAVPFGALVAIGVWLAARPVRGLAGLAALVLGAVGAALLAWWLGRNLGLGSYLLALAAAQPGDVLARPPDLAVAELGWWPPRVLGVLLVPALVAAATYTLVAAWSRFPTLRPEPDEPAGWPGP